MPFTEARASRLIYRFGTMVSSWKSTGCWCGCSVTAHVGEHQDGRRQGRSRTILATFTGPCPSSTRSIVGRFAENVASRPGSTYSDHKGKGYEVHGGDLPRARTRASSSPTWRYAPRVRSHTDVSSPWALTGWERRSGELFPGLDLAILADDRAAGTARTNGEPASPPPIR